MDVALLSRMIGELMPDLDSLSLPGLGTFRSEQMGASFSDKGYTINPPYRRLTFTSKETEDGLLAEAYASSNGITPQEADKLLRSFTAVLAKELRSVKSVELPGLGRLRATREDHFFFVPDQDLDISPEACGLQSVSLKSHPAPLPPLPEIPVPSIVTAPAAIVSAAVGSQTLDEGKAPAAPSDGVGTTPATPVHLAGEPEDAGTATVAPGHLTVEPEVAGTATAANVHLTVEPEDAGSATATPDNLARKAVEAGSAPADLGPYEREVGALPAGTAGTTETAESVKSTVTTESTGATGTTVTTEAIVTPGSAETPESTTPTETSTPAVPARATRGTAAKKARKPFPKPLAWTLGAVVAAAIFLGGFVVVSRLAPSFTDSLLYTPEQLAIINAPEDGADISR